MPENSINMVLFITKN